MTGPDDPALDGFRRLNEPRFRRRLENRHGVFVAEGPTVVDRIARRHPGLVEAVLVDERRIDRVPAGLDAPIHALSEADIRSVVGFPFHRGILALCRRPPESGMDHLDAVRSLAVLEGVNDHTNLGAVVRAAVGLGVGGVLLDPTTADPWYRRSVRVSMGTVLDIPIVRSGDWADALGRVSRSGFTLIAASPDGDDQVASIGPVARPAIALGAEGSGLTESVRSRSTVSVRIPMQADVDSLNLGQAAAVLFHRLVPIDSRGGATSEDGDDGGGGRASDRHGHAGDLGLGPG